MPRFDYPLHFKFRVTTLSNDFTVTDASERTIGYVREKLFKWRDHIKVYADSSKSTLLYEMVSNKLIDFQQTFTITDSQSNVLGMVRRKSLRSLWRSTFFLRDKFDNHDYTIQEKNPWTKLGDSLFGEIPIIGVLSGYVLNPSYLLKDQQGEDLFEIRKEPSFFGRKFTVYKLTADDIDEDRLVLSMMLMVLTERANG